MIVVPCATRQGRHYVLQQTTRLEVFVDRARSLLVPAFQRPYVWEERDRARLLDSVLAGLSIGHVLLWSTSRWGDEYVLDGQQRTTSLLRMADEAEPDPSFQAGVSVRVGDDDVVLPLWLLLRWDVFRFREWVDEQELTRRSVDAILRVVSRVRDYEVSTTTVVGDEAYAREVYRLHNTTGVVVDPSVVRTPTSTCPRIADLIESARARHHSIESR